MSQNDDRRILGAGLIVVKYDVDEEDGQEDDLDEEAER